MWPQVRLLCPASLEGPASTGFPGALARVQPRVPPRTPRSPRWPSQASPWPCRGWAQLPQPQEEAGPWPLCGLLADLWAPPLLLRLLSTEAQVPAMPARALLPSHACPPWLQYSPCAARGVFVLVVGDASTVAGGARSSSWEPPWCLVRAPELSSSPLCPSLPPSRHLLSLSSRLTPTGMAWLAPRPPGQLPGPP